MQVNMKNEKSLDEIVVTKVDGLKLYDLKTSIKNLEERYPELADKTSFLWGSCSRTSECNLLCWQI